VRPHDNNNGACLAAILHYLEIGRWLADRPATNKQV
jgi:hypothetical protein